MCVQHAEELHQQQGESIWIRVQRLKGYYGHTLGAAGLLECILSQSALSDGCILPTLGYEQYGVVQPMTICERLIATEKSCFLKLISGFGGSNAVICYERVR